MASILNTGWRLDEAVSREIMKVVQPTAIEAALVAAKKTDAQQDDLIRALELELQAARYTADRTYRQFDAVDPANRLVADELERGWELALRKERQLEERVEKACAQRQQTLSPDSAVFENLAGNLHKVWNHRQTDVRLKKRIVRTLPIIHFQKDGRLYLMLFEVSISTVPPQTILKFL